LEAELGQLDCIPLEMVEANENEVDVEDAVESQARQEDGQELDVEPIVVEAMERTEGLFNEFAERVLSRDLLLDPSNAAKHEVLCGLVSRASRAVYATLQAPHMWSGEHGSTVMRILAETRIVITWMDLQDPAIYAQYQNYGRGKAKLMRRHLETLIETSGEAVPIDVRELAERLKKKAGGDLGEAFQEVSVDTTFSGLTMRKMAEEAGLMDVYRYLYQPTSGVTHGEWWAIEDYAMQRCVNPLHMVHHIPSFQPEFPIEPMYSRLLVAQLDGIMRQVLAILAPADTK